MCYHFRSNRKDDYLIYGLHHHLCKNDAQNGLSAHHPPECQWIKNARIQQFTAYGRKNSSTSKSPASGKNLHLAYYESIGIASYKEGQQRRDGGAWHHAEKLIERRGHLLAPRLYRLRQKADKSRCHSHESAHRKSEPYHKAGFAIAVHLRDAVIDDVRDRKKDDSP